MFVFLFPTYFHLYKKEKRQKGTLCTFDGNKD